MSKPNKDTAQPAPKNWWQNLPTVLKATAAVVTGLTALVVALQQAGVFHGSPDKLEGGEGGSNPPRVPAVTGPPTRTERFPMTLPAGMETKAEGVGYKVLVAKLDRHSEGKLELQLTMRVSSGDSANAQLHPDSFRLLVDGESLSPDTSPSEYVPPQSSREGEVSFVIPESTTRAELQVGRVGNPTSKMAIDLKGK